MPQRKQNFLFHVLIVTCLPWMPSAMAAVCELETHDAERWLERVNEIRSEPRHCGSVLFASASPVKWNAALLHQARRQARTMAERRQLSHLDASGKGLGDHLLAAGYRWRIQGEVIAAGYSDVEATLQGWLDSPPHCAILMNGQMLEIGAACTPSLEGDIYASYWSMSLAAPKP